MTKTVQPSDPALAVAILMLASGLFAALNAIPGLFVVPCVHPVAGNSALSLAIVAALVLAAGRIWRGALHVRQRRMVGLLTLSTALLLWLGSYRYSPLGFADGRLPILRGFVITRAGVPQRQIASGDVLSLTGTSVIGVQALTGLEPVNCKWMSENGGALDGNDTCDIAYTPPHSEIDRLIALVDAGCGLPPVRGEIGIVVLP